MRHALPQRWRDLYHRSSIQLILSLSFTAAAAIGLIFMGLALFLLLTVRHALSMGKGGPAASG